jgi:hypothetical protein
VTVIALALGLKASKDLGGGRFGFDTRCLPQVMELLVSDGAKSFFPYMRTPKGLNLTARLTSNEYLSS